MHKACEERRLSAVKQLLCAGANVDAVDLVPNHYSYLRYTEWTGNPHSQITWQTPKHILAGYPEGQAFFMSFELELSDSDLQWMYNLM